MSMDRLDQHQQKQQQQQQQKLQPQKKPKGKPRGRNGAGTASIEKNTTARPEEIARAVQNAFQYFHRDIVKSDEECAERINGYFRDCYEQQMIPTVENLSLALGTVRRTLWDWENGICCTKERSNMIKKAKQILASIDAELVSAGKIPQVVYIFRAKNFYQMADQQEIKINAAPDQEDRGVEDVRKWLEDGGTVESIFTDDPGAGPGE